MTGSPPQHWTQQAGPNAWFQLWHPPGWHVEASDGATSLAAPGGGGILTVSSFWLDPADRRRPRLADLADPSRLFPKHRQVRAIRGLDIGDESLGFEGEAPLTSQKKWWKVLGRNKWKRFRLWCVRQENVHLLALFMQTEEFDPESATMAEMVLNTIAFPDQLALPPDLFAQRVLNFARERFPSLPCERGDDFQLRIGDTRINLFNFYRSYVNAPDQFENIVMPALTTVVQVQSWGPSKSEPDFDQVRERIMPMLYPEQAWKERFPNFIGTDWAAGLVTLYVVDETQAYWYLRDELLERWGISEAELHELALENLDRYFEEQPMELTVAGDDDGPRILIPSRPDAYNSARLLSPRFHDNLHGILGNQFAVGAPSRDFFVALTLNSPETLDHVKGRVSADFKQMDHPLSDRLLLFTYDGVTEYSPWEPV